MRPKTCWDAGQCATMACLMEAAAEKPGNVHPQARFNDMTFADMMSSAVAIGPAMRQARSIGVGMTVWQAVNATQAATGKNTNLGSILLLAPLACLPPQGELNADLVFRSLTPLDAQLVYQAIRRAAPGGLGQSSQHDIADSPPECLLQAMRFSADRDLIARQYATSFADLRERLLPWWMDELRSGRSWDVGIVQLQLRIMSCYPDSLIARKCGMEVAAEAQRRAQQVLAAAQPGSADQQARLENFDLWLRADGNRRNPGTTADLIAAVLFCWLRSIGTLDQWMGVDEQPDRSRQGN